MSNEDSLIKLHTMENPNPEPVVLTQEQLEAETNREEYELHLEPQQQVVTDA